MTHPKSAVAFCSGGGATTPRGAATHLKSIVLKLADNDYGASVGAETNSIIDQNRWVAAPLGVVAPPPGQNATALFGCVIMSH